MGHMQRRKSPERPEKVKLSRSLRNPDKTTITTAYAKAENVTATVPSKWCVKWSLILKMNVKILVLVYQHMLVNLNGPSPEAPKESFTNKIDGLTTRTRLQKRIS